MGSQQPKYHTNMNDATQCLKIAAKGIHSRRHLRLVRAKFEKSTSKLSTNLRDSALANFDRIAKANGTFTNY